MSQHIIRLDLSQEELAILGNALSVVHGLLHGESVRPAALVQAVAAPGPGKPCREIVALEARLVTLALKAGVNVGTVEMRGPEE